MQDLPWVHFQYGFQWHERNDQVSRQEQNGNAICIFTQRYCGIFSAFRGVHLLTFMPLYIFWCAPCLCMFSVNGVDVKVDVIVSSAGGIEEDFIKCLGPTGLGSFSLDGSTLRKKGLNRIGNLLVPNDNYCKFEDWVVPILDEALDEQKKNGTIFTPSTLIELLGRRINNEDSIYYWASKNNIPVFCPAITDGSLGDMLFFHTYKKPGFIVDVVGDIRRMNRLAIDAPCSGMIILGGGMIKHHIANANLMRNGAEFSVYINTGQEFDGSDAGASPDEAVSWGKIKGTAQKTKVSVDATLVFPLLVAQTFAKNRHVFKQ